MLVTHEKMSFDVVFVDGLQLSATVGPDCWGRIRPQPVVVSVCLHLQSDYLTQPGLSDKVEESIHYGHLAKAVTALVTSRDAQFSSVGNLVSAVTAVAFRLAGEAVEEVRVRVEVPKMILLAANFAVEVVTSAGGDPEGASRTVTVTDLSLSVVIGVNPPERRAKQRVVTNLVFRERRGLDSTVDYPSIVAQISEVRLHTHGNHPSLIDRITHASILRRRRISHWRSLCSKSHGRCARRRKPSTPLPSERRNRAH